MIEVLTNMPAKTVGFRATGDVTKEDYEAVVFPVIEKQIRDDATLNYLMIIDTPFEKFTLGAWWKDTVLSLIKPGIRHKAAIITPSSGANKFTDVWGNIMPGEFRGYLPTQMKEALAWLSS